MWVSETAAGDLLTLGMSGRVARRALPAKNGSMTDPGVADASSNSLDESPQVDGRRAWRERNRLAVVDALLDFYAEGNLRPDAIEVARRSGVSRRSVFRYFDDRDDLDRAAIARQQQRVMHLIEVPSAGEGSLAERIARLAEQRVTLFEQVRPAARVSRHEDRGFGRCDGPRGDDRGDGEPALLRH
jgi:hypothetical protein